MLILLPAPVPLFPPSPDPPVGASLGLSFGVRPNSSPAEVRGDRGPCDSVSRRSRPCTATGVEEGPARPSYGVDGVPGACEGCDGESSMSIMGCSLNVSRGVKWDPWVRA